MFASAKSWQLFRVSMLTGKHDLKFRNSTIIYPICKASFWMFLVAGEVDLAHSGHSHSQSHESRDGHSHGDHGDGDWHDPSCTDSSHGHSTLVWELLGGAWEKVSGKDTVTNEYQSKLSESCTFDVQHEVMPMPTIWTAMIQTASSLSSLSSPIFFAMFSKNATRRPRPIAWT